jgi:arylsulfatase A-like enzyme
MYSNDMWEYHPENPQAYSKYPLQFWEDGKVAIERMTPEDQTTLTRRYTERAIDFIRKSSAKPFFLYVPHSMPHVPLYCSEKFRGKSGKGLYADVMLEIDWSVGEILSALKSAGVEQNTLVLFTSDNGPWSYYGNHAGKTPFRESKGTSFDGGTRSACIVRYPGLIRAGSVSKRTFCSIDLLPTIAHLTGARLPSNPIDGKNVWDLIAGKQDASNPHDYYPFYTGPNFDGVLSSDGRWKLHLPHAYRTIAVVGADGKAGKYGEARIDLSLFDMENDPMESTNVIDRFPEVAARLKSYAEQHRKQFFQTP